MSNMTSIGDVCTYLAIAGPVKAARTVNNALRIDLVSVQKVANQRSQVVLLHIRRDDGSKLFVSPILVWVRLNDRRKKIEQRKCEDASVRTKQHLLCVVFSGRYLRPAMD